MSALLEVRNLRVEFPTRRGTLRALDDVSFSIQAGEVLGVVGESGAGKSLTGASIIGLLEPPGRIAAGEILLAGRRIDNLPDEQMRRVRGREIGAVFQDPLTSLNPLYTVGRQLAETIVTHLDMSWSQARNRAVELLAATGIPAARERIDHYPHQFSGGMRQRVVIALALAAEPKLVVADEPTTALDVSIQAQAPVPRTGHGGDADYARHGRDRGDGGPGGGDVCGAGGRDRARARRHPPAAPSVHDGADGVYPVAAGAFRAAGADRWQHAAVERDSAGLCLQSALRPAPAALWPGPARTDAGGHVPRGLLVA